MECIVEILSIGNELLIGKIANTNAQWLAKRITSLGGRVRRITVVGDTLEDISTALKNALERTPTLIITTGGLGPTFDDMTVEGIAQTLHTPVQVNDEALEMVKEKYRQYSTPGKTIELTPARVKMATLPREATPLHNPVGTAPGILVQWKKSKIIALPGVPKEMEAIFETSVESLIRRTVGNTVIRERSLKVAEIMESTMAPLIDEVMEHNPHVYIKSHPKDSESHPLLELHLVTAAKTQDIAEKRVNTAVTEISNLIVGHGGKTELTASSREEIKK